MAKTKPRSIGAESIALNKSKQSAFAKAVKQAKKAKLKNLPKKEKEQDGGCIIKLDHVPHGFYEDQMKSYFTQFGKVMRVRLARSSKTGKSRGFAFVQFEFEEVAKIAAEAMNNYLMFERLIKCQVLPSTANAKKLFQNSYIKESNYPKLKARNKVKLDQANPISEEESDKFLQKRLEKIQTRNAKLQELGISYEFNLKTEVPLKKRDSEGVKTEKKAKQTPTPIKSNKKKSVISTPVLKTPETKQSPKQKQDAKTPEAKKSPKQKQEEKTVTTIVKSSETPKKSPKVSTPISNSKKSKAGLATPGQLTPSISPKMGKNTGKITPKSVSSTPKRQTTPITQKSPKGKQSLSPIIPSYIFEEDSDEVNVQEQISMGQKGKKRKASELPKFSPKLLRTRENDKKASKQNDVDDETKVEATPKGKNKRKSVAPEQKEITPAKTKFSPKLLRSRKSQGPVVAEKEKKTPAGKKTKVSDLPKISPKMLRSRKSEAVVVAPSFKINATPAKGKKAGRKSMA